MKAKARVQRLRMSRGSKRVIADPQHILAAAREIGLRDGWKAVTIRAIAERLGYAAPVLYEHFRNKEDVLTQIAVEGLRALNRDLRKPIDTGTEAAILVLVGRYWKYMLKHAQMYRLMNGMDGVPVDGAALGAAAREVCEVTGQAIEQWLVAHNTISSTIDELADSVWALLHGMASLYLGRAAQFDVCQAKRAVLQLLLGVVTLTASKSDTDR